MSSRTEKLRALLARDVLSVIPGCHDALSARLIEAAGFEAAFMSGFGITASRLSQPDMSIMSYEEMVETGRTICDAVTIPVIGDADTGFGNVMNVRRTVAGYARAGFAALAIEDQSYPKRCGWVKGVDVVDRSEARQRVRAAVAARDQEENKLLVIGRTDATSVHGIQEGIDRAKMFEDLGADIIYLEGTTNRKELEQFCRRVTAPKLFVAASGRNVILPTHRELREMGYSIVVWCVALLNSSVYAMQHALEPLKSGSILPETIPHAELERVVGVDSYLEEMSRLQV
jgi:2-methylisocitrate lyase-like PEP mutase family enzyme